MSIPNWLLSITLAGAIVILLKLAGVGAACGYFPENITFKYTCAIGWSGW